MLLYKDIMSQLYQLNLKAEPSKLKNIKAYEPKIQKLYCNQCPYRPTS